MEYTKGSGLSFEISPLYSDNGLKSIHCTSEENISSSWIRFPVSISSGDIGKSVTMKVKIYTDISCNVHLMLNDVVSTSVMIPSNEVPQVTEVELTTTISEGTEYVKLNVGPLNATTPVKCYIDSLECYL